MDLNEIINIIVNNGVAVGVIIYFMFVNKKQLDQNNEALHELKEAIIKLIEKLDKMEEEKGDDKR